MATSTWIYPSATAGVKHREVGSIKLSFLRAVTQVPCDCRWHGVGSRSCCWMMQAIKAKAKCHFALQSGKQKHLCRAIGQLEEGATIDNSTVLVVGGGGLGMEVVRNLAKAGSWVTVFQRGEKFRQEVESLGAMLVLGDVMDSSTIDKALRSSKFDAVICTVGGGTKNAHVDRDGCINVMNAAKRAEVKRFILVSSIGVGDSVVAVDQQTLDVLKVVLDAKAVAEGELKASGLIYTILRPGGLLNGPSSGKCILTEDPRIGGLIARADVALLIMKLLFRKEAEYKIFSAVNSEKVFGPPSILEDVKILSLT